MQKRLAKLFEVRAGEGRLVGLLVVLAVCLGFTRQFTQTAAGTLFLREFDVAQLPYVYVGVALLVPLVGVGYNYLETRLSLTWLQTVNLALHLVVLSSLWLLLTFPTAQALVPGASFALSVWYEAVWAFTGLAVWSLAGRLFNVRQAKRLFGLISTGDILAATVAGIVTGWWVEGWGTPSLLLGALVGLLGALAVVGYFQRSDYAPLLGAEEASALQRTAKATPLQQRYARLIIALAVVSYLAFYFIDNIFYTVVEGRLATDEAELAGFLGGFWAVVNLLTLVTNLLLVGPWTNRFGLRAGLLVVPLAVGGVTLVLALSGLSGVWRVWQDLVFWLVILNTFFDWLLGETFYKSANLILYQPLPAAQRTRLQALVESLAQPVAQGGAGILLLGLSLLALNIFQQNYLLLAFIGVWGALVVLVTRDYGQVLTQALAKRRLGQGTALNDPNSLQLLRRNLNSQHPGTVLYALDMLVQAENPTLEADLLDLLQHPSPVVRAESCRRLEALNLNSAAPHLHACLHRETEPTVRGVALRAWVVLADEDVVEEVMPYLTAVEPEVREGALIGLLKHGSLGGVLTAGDRLNQLLLSAEPADRIIAARVLGEVGNRQFYQPMLKLLNDPEIGVRRAALEAAGRIGSLRLWPTVLGALETSTHLEAALALAAAGEVSLPLIGSALNNPNLDLRVRHRLIRVLGRINHPESITLLLKALEAPLIHDRQTAAQALMRRDYRAQTSGEIQRIYAALRLEAAQAAWFLAGLADLAALPMAVLITAALNELVQTTRQQMFNLLLLLYPAQTILRVRDSLRQPTAEQQAYAVETLDTLLAQEIKGLVLPLVDELPVAQRLERLAVGTAQPRLDPEVRLQMIWETTDETLQWLRACAAWEADDGTLTITVEERTEMLNLIDKVLILKTVGLFADTPDNVIAEVASLLTESDLHAGEQLFAKGDPGNCMYVIVQGKVRVHDGPRLLNYLGERAIVGEMAMLDSEPRTASVTAEEETILLRLDQDELYELMADRIEVTRGIIRVLTTHLRARVNDVNSLQARVEVLSNHNPAVA